jgi:hypothetical protein
MCVPDFSVLGSRQTEPLRGAGKFIVMAISTFLDWSLVRSLRSRRDRHHKNALYHGWNGLPYSTAGVPAE